MSDMTSARVAGLSLNRPRTADVRVRVPGLRTPRIDMHRCSASIITNAPARLQDVDDRVGDLRREPLLHLRPLGEAVDQPGELRQAGDAAVVTGDVRDVRAAVERDEVVLAERVQRDVAHQHHLVVIGLERDDEMARGIFVQTAADLGVHLGDPLRRAQQPVAVGVLADREEDLAHGLLDPREVDARVFTVADVGAHVNLCSIAPVNSAMNGRLR